MKTIFLVLAGFTSLFMSACSKDGTPLPPFVKVGDRKNGGIIFYVDSTRRHGLVASLSDQSEGISWSHENGPKDVPTAHDEMGGGEANTALIVTTFGEGTYAASLCDKLVLNGYDDWYLPNRAELHQLYKLKDYIGGFADDYYWTSDFAGSNPPVYYADNLNFENGIRKMNSEMFQESKNRVRAIRAF